LAAKLEEAYREALARARLPWWHRWFKRRHFPST
jgi:hypothetical protein